MFKIANIAKRESVNGFNGLRYAPNVTQMTKHENVSNPKPSLNKNFFSILIKNALWTTQKCMGMSP